jgi:hypothetical protein
MKLLRKLWGPLFILIALAAGILLRVLFVEDMEYKEDEQFNFLQTQLIGKTQPWPWVGIASGVYIVNPGMSIWVFTLLAKLLRIHQPTHLAYAIQGFALLGICLIIPFVFLFLKDLEERKIWLWAFALSLVNPFLVLYQRKLWPEPFLPFFTLITLMGWWKKSTRAGAFFWGLVGAILGQIHMSGFFFAAALALWTLAFDRNAKWRAWFVGSFIGALPLIPWLIYLISHPTHQPVGAGWNEMIQLKYWVFWLTDPLGLHLGNALGVSKGNSLWIQIEEFLHYPLLFGRATYLVGVAHAVIILFAICIWLKGLRGIWHSPLTLKSQLIGNHSSTAFAQNSALIACGLLMTLTGVTIRRYYMTVTFPLEFIFLIRWANPSSISGKTLLATLWICELFISSNFVGYIHVNNGAPQGDYGISYKKQLQEDPGHH